MNDPHWDLLINAHLDDALTAAERTEFETLMLESAAARQRFWELAEVHGLAREAARQAWPEETTVTAPLPGLRCRFPVRQLLAAAAALALLAVAAFLVVNPGKEPVLVGEPGAGLPAILTVTEIAGSVQWLGEEGLTRGIAETGARIPAGTLGLAGETEVAEFLFADGTRIDLRGPAELVVAEDDGQKRLHLRSGLLTADVMPQPEGRPMIVRTPASENVVLGTRFELFADPDRTALAVDHGKVQLRRLADGRTAEVTAGQLVVSHRLAATPLEQRERPSPRSRWAHTFETPPPGKWTGDWLEPEDALPGRMAAVPVPTRHGHTPDTRHFRVMASSGIGWLVRISPETTVRVRYRFERRAVPIGIFAHTSKKHGGYGGNFEVKLGNEAQPAPSEDGWRTFEGRLGDFRALVPERYPEVPDGGGLEFVYLGTWENDGGLELAEIEFATP
jgi:ferric-dicitrate binding protein FerR (iron transport regulator)